MKNKFNACRNDGDCYPSKELPVVGYSGFETKTKNQMVILSHEAWYFQENSASNIGDIEKFIRYLIDAKFTFDIIENY